MHEIRPEFRTAVKRLPRLRMPRGTIRLVRSLLGLARSLVRQPIDDTRREIDVLSNRPTRLGIEVRTGAYTGEVTFGDNDLAGIGVHVAARDAGLAGTSEAWASSTVKDLSNGSGLTFEDIWEHELRGVPDRWRLYRVTS